MLGADGALDRSRLGDIVFADKEKLAVLNAIVHPLVGARMRELEDDAGPGSVVVHDVPLIAENGLTDAYDLVVVVDVPPRIQLDRLVKAPWPEPRAGAGADDRPGQPVVFVVRRLHLG